MPLLRLRPVAGSGPAQEREFSGPRVRIGRSRDNDLILPERDDPSSSGHHAEVQLDANGAWSIVDTGSSNGTRVNGVPVRRQRLKNGDRLSFGDEQFLVSIGPAERRRFLPLVLAAALVALIVGGLVVLQWSEPRTFEGVAASAAPSVFMIAIEADGQRSMVGSGFAISADGWLATNAHIADALLGRGALSPATTGVRAVAVQGDTYSVYRVVGSRLHPSWKPGSLAHDVALIQIEGQASTVPLQLANAARLAGLARGTPIAAFGFPAVSTDPANPRGRLSADVVGDVRGDYLEVGLGISPGMSGCPVLDRSGEVVAVVVGGDFVEMPDGMARPSGSSANWALSASLVREMLTSR